jgi:methylated-DNA-[protein]-cysteine S-methyltransferase
VLASGFTTDIDGLLALVRAEVRPIGAPRLRRDLGPATKAVAAYLDGDLTAVDDVPVRQHPNGEFQTLALAALRKVPAGRPVSYAGFAALAGRPAAVRAAAGVCARNPAALFVPCHRVVRTDGSLGGYRWGLEVKRWLLDFEDSRGPENNET